MAEIVQRPKVEVSATMLFNEAELRALDALVGYGVDPFLKVFYEKLGKHYMQPHEAGLRTLFESVRQIVPSILGRTDDARRVFSGERVALHADTPDRLKDARSQIADLSAQLGAAKSEIITLTAALAAQADKSAAADGGREG